MQAVAEIAEPHAKGAVERLPEIGLARALSFTQQPREPNFGTELTWAETHQLHEAHPLFRGEAGVKDSRADGYGIVLKTVPVE